MSSKPPCDHKFVDSKVCLKCGWEPPKDFEHKLALRVKDGRIVALSAALRDVISVFKGQKLNLSVERIEAWKKALEDYGEPE